LRLIYELSLKNVNGRDDGMMTDIFNDTYYEDTYGTPYHASSASSSTIYNVIDAEVRLREAITDIVFQTANETQYQHSTCVGTMKIYMDPDSNKSMTFDPVM
jgi:hypothetical protein